MARLVLVLLLTPLLAGCTAPEPLDAEPPGPVQAASMAHATAPTNQTPPPHASAASEARDRSPPPRNESAMPEPAPVVVAVLDNGIDPEHEAFAPGQVVAWYDFGRDGRPAGVPNVTWDPAVEPYARNDHGPGTASMVGGNGTDQTPSHAPGVALAIGQVALNDAGGTSWHDLADAIHWAVDVVGADVISISKYRHAPGTTTPNDRVLLDAIQYARDAGVLPVVLAGNGYQHPDVPQRLPTASWLHAPATSPHALVVGGAGSDGEPVTPRSSMDPEVTALHFARVACAGATDCYHDRSGTSFSTPLVAGMAARLLLDAHDAGIDVDADRLEALLKGCARDTAAPPTLEGHGFLDADGLACARKHLADGTTPGTDLVNHAYTDVASDVARGAWGGL